MIKASYVFAMSDQKETLRQLDPKYRWKVFLYILFFSLFFYFWIFLTLLLSEAIALLFWISLFGLAFLFFSWFLAKWHWHFFKYELGEKSFRIKSGILWKHYIDIPYSRIQNIGIKRGLFDRILGLSSLWIHTAGSAVPYYTEGKLPGLSIGEAEQLREELIKRANATQTSTGL